MTFPKRPTLAGLATVLAIGALAACSSSSSSKSAPSTSGATQSTTSTAPAPTERVKGGSTGTYLVAAGVHKIKHVIVIQQENRSFDSYFGTFPGADGIPMKNGKPTVCVTDPKTKQCVYPYRRPQRRERRRTAQPGQ